MKNGRAKVQIKPLKYIKSPDSWLLKKKKNSHSNSLTHSTKGEVLSRDESMLSYYSAVIESNNPTYHVASYLCRFSRLPPDPVNKTEL